VILNCVLSSPPTCHLTIVIASDNVADQFFISSAERSEHCPGWVRRVMWGGGKERDKKKSMLLAAIAIKAEKNQFVTSSTEREFSGGEA
jgi:hypothetical protein